MMFDHDDWQRVCARKDIPLLGARVLKREAGGDIALFRAQDDHLFALLDRCPHRGGPLSQGIVHGRSVTCPLHGWGVGLDDGHAVAPDQGCTRVFQLREFDGQVYLRRDELHVADTPQTLACGT